MHGQPVDNPEINSSTSRHKIVNSLRAEVWFIYLFIYKNHPKQRYHKLF